jgi:hypothetical protein
MAMTTKTRSRRRSTNATRLSGEERQRRVKDSIADTKQRSDTDARFAGWEDFFRSMMKPFLDESYPYNDYRALKSGAPLMAQVAFEGMLTLMVAKNRLAQNNIHGVAVSLMDMAVSVGQMFFLDIEADADLGQAARKHLKLGPQSVSRNAEQRAKMIRAEVAEIQNSSPVRLSSTSAREALARKRHFDDGTEMVSLGVIHNAFSRKHAERDGQPRPKKR